LDPDSRIYIECAAQSFKVEKTRLFRMCQSLLGQLNVEQYELSISFVTSSEIQRLNKEYRSKNTVTDVLSFASHEFDLALKSGTSAAHSVAKDSEAPRSLGDIVISLDQAFEQAKNIGQTLDREVAFLIVHGMLHLCGHDHITEEDEQVMINEQKLLMKALEASAPPLWTDCVKFTQETSE
jgi:probable rRNA maturation factor